VPIAYLHAPPATTQRGSTTLNPDELIRLSGVAADPAGRASTYLKIRPRVVTLALARPPSWLSRDALRTVCSTADRARRVATRPWRAFGRRNRIAHRAASHRATARLAGDWRFEGARQPPHAFRSSWGSLRSPTPAADRGDPMTSPAWTRSRSDGIARSQRTGWPETPA